MVTFTVRRDFNRLWLIGIEYDLLLFDIMTFMFVCWFTDYNVAAAGVVTFVADLLLVKIRQWFSEKNISYKTLVDYRFLL